MAGERTRMLLAVTFNGYPLLGEVEGHNPPTVEKETEDSRGGRFAGTKSVVGVALGDWTLKVAGASAELLQAYGVTEGAQTVQVDVKSTEKDVDGRLYGKHYSYTGEILKVEEDELKMGSKPMVTVTGHPKAYKQTEDGKTIYDIDLKTQVIDLGSGDIMLEARRKAGLP